MSCCGTTFAECFALWLTMRLPEAHAKLTAITGCDPNWWAALCDSDAPAGFTDMMTTIDDATDEPAVMPLADIIASLAPDVVAAIQVAR